MESGKDKYTVAKWLYFFCLDNLQNVNTIPATKACGQNAHKVAFAVQDTPQFECNKFHVVKHIDPGSFGEVFLTEFRNTDKEPTEKVVVKRILEIQDKEDTKRFIKEVQIMNKLKHPNIVELRRVCFAPCALMMEYMRFSFMPFESDIDISVCSLQIFLVCINDRDYFGFEDDARHAGKEIGKLL